MPAAAVVISLLAAPVLPAARPASVVLATPPARVFVLARVLLVPAVVAAVIRPARLGALTLAASRVGACGGAAARPAARLARRRPVRPGCAIVAVPGRPRRDAAHRGSGHQRSRAHLGRDHTGARAGGPAQLRHPRRGRLGRRGPRNPQQQSDGRHGCRTRPQRVACAVQELSHRSARHAELGSDLLVGATLELAQDDCVALALGQRLHRRHHFAQPLGALERLVRSVYPVDPLVELVVTQPSVPQRVERCVVRDPIQPGAKVERGLVAQDRLVCAHERLLHGVLGPLARQETLRVPKQRVPIARHDRLECRLVARAHEVDQAGVGLGRQHGPAGQSSRSDERLRSHGAGTVKTFNTREAETSRGLDTEGSSPSGPSYDQRLARAACSPSCDQGSIAPRAGPATLRAMAVPLVLLVLWLTAAPAQASASPTRSIGPSRRPRRYTALRRLGTRAAHRRARGAALAHLAPAA